jgi:hypothetical protein
MAKEIDCPCGQTVKGEDDDQLIANTEPGRARSGMVE